jgi:hypothetical protein
MENDIKDMLVLLLSLVKQVKLKPNLRTTNKFAEINPKA